MVFDTGSDWLVIPDKNCSNCDGRRHDNLISGIAVDNKTITERNYGSASLQGYTWKDKVCLGSSVATCALNMTYFSFIQQRGINDPLEGILGLSQNKQMMLSSEEMIVGPIFPNELFKQGKLLTPSFSFAMNGYQSDEPSTVDFGNTNPMRANLTARITLGFNDDFFWSTYMQAVKFGNYSEYAIDGSPYAIFDTGVSHLMVPPLLLEPFIDNIIGAAGGKAEYAIQDGMIFVNCKQRNLFKPISFMFSEYYIQIDPSEYIWDAYGDNTVCSMLLLANQYDFFFFG